MSLSTGNSGRSVRAGDSTGRLSVPTRRLLFRSVQPSDALSAVVSRLRAAIISGLLSDGDKLPREADLAKELGVSSFSLREALSVLRSDGLIVTRPGNNGGSFVQRPQEPLSLARAELVRLSSSELRDLGDWRQMLTTTAAGLAALRATGSDADRLTLYGEQVATADGDDQARRAYARYHVELAAAAQSTRLSRAQFSMHEEFDWLMGLILSDPEHRRDIAQALSAVTRAIRHQRRGAAQIAAQQHVTAVIKELGRLRLGLLAAQHRPADTAANRKESTCFAADIRRFAEHIVNQLTLLAEETAEPLAAGDGPAAIQQRVAQALFSRLDAIHPAIHGLGIIAEVGAVPGRPHWLDWWQRTEACGLERDTRHVMDPRRDDFYDYESREFFALPRKNLTPSATGPYVDHGGVDDYLITVSVPIVSNGRFRGVAAADLLVANLERGFAGHLASASAPCLLLNAEQRVIVSNTVTHNVGDIALTAEFEIVGLGVLGWSLVTQAS